MLLKAHNAACQPMAKMVRKIAYGVQSFPLNDVQLISSMEYLRHLELV